MKIIKPEVKHGIVYRDDENHRFRTNGWPSACIDDKGVLYVVASTHRLGHGDPFGKNGMWLSYDLGETWSCTHIIHDSNYDDRDMGIIYMGNGKLGVSSFTQRGYYGGFYNASWCHPADRELLIGGEKFFEKLGEEREKEEVMSFVMFSDNYGFNWGKPIRVPVSAPHGFSQCKDGRLIYLGKYCETDIENYGEDMSMYPIRFYQSTDEGRTWEYLSDVPLGEGLLHHQFEYEPHVVELPNGRLLGAIRVHCRSVEPFNTVYTTFSDDKGKTWSQPKLADEGIDGLPPHLLVHSSGAVILSYGCREEGRWAEKAAVSHDGGETWSENYILDDNINEAKDLGYPATVELPDGSLFTTYYQGYEHDWYCSVLYTKWKLEK